ncbi:MULTISPECIES: hypothetical protein [unclassified Mycobacterium]|uniref:hypothetical protein n=1 Tax=unclassified Mycobacterium TaxID=2642494 RepID=UPI00074022B4|nr:MULTISPECIES: hypothetical protein [unclassified Mycobacterium]KUH85791.1 hypothetical protein AU186_24015 [Mycobacterium sp. GA-1999]KUH91764.1 hypothetical protein AU185_11080 [Mycobacterium sp. GA-0227b]KUH96522.1 hypothetical protein AU187_12850 [Mycobacterium sp. IS-1556]
MADQQGRPDEQPQGSPPADESTPQPAAAESAGTSADPLIPPAPAQKTPAKKAPAKKAAKKTPAKKAAKKAAPAKKAVKKAPAKKAPAKKAPAPEPAGTATNLESAAKVTAAQAKSTVASASNPVSGPAPVPLIGPEPSRLPVAAAIAAGVLAILVVLLIRRGSGDD